jgi:hypothetical protein
MTPRMGSISNLKRKGQRNEAFEYHACAENFQSSIGDISSSRVLDAI